MYILAMMKWSMYNFKIKILSIEKCPKCKATKGWKWTWGKNDGHSTGYSTCIGCGAKF